MDTNIINAGVLAYLGDSVYEVKIRYYLICKMSVKAHELKEESIKYVSAINQALILEYLFNNNLLTDDELAIVRRARNYKTKSKPKHASIISYKKATALEALFGYLYINNNDSRINELIKIIMG